jgi:hypothetical protein
LLIRLIQARKPFVERMAGAIPRGWPGQGRRFVIRFTGAEAVVDEEIAHYMVRMPSANLRMTAAQPGDLPTFDELEPQVMPGPDDPNKRPGTTLRDIGR